MSPPPPNHHLQIQEIHLDPLLALYCNTFDISVGQRVPRIVFNKVAHFRVKRLIVHCLLSLLEFLNH